MSCGIGYVMEKIIETIYFQVGDQIVRINGYSVEHAIHQEVLKLIQDSNHLNLKVRSKFIYVYYEESLSSPIIINE